MGILHTYLLGHVGGGNKGLAIWQRSQNIDYFSV
jgi:hypothetical protein